MKTTLTKPPIPILWIDTWLVLELAVALDSKNKKRKSYAEKVVQTIIELTKNKELICPEGDQGIEIEVSNNKQLVDKARKLQTQISQGISLNYFAAVEDLQTQRMMKAYLEEKDEVVFPWEDIFTRDPVEEIERNDPFIVSVHIPQSRKTLDERIETNKSIARDWEKIRKQALKDKQKYPSKLEQEFGGKAEAMVHIMSDLAARTIHKKKISTKRLLRSMEIVGKPLAWWERYSKKQNDLVGLLKFYKSNEYREIPSVNVGTRMLADLVSGNEEVKQGDVMDIHHVATVLPYCKYLVVDKRIKNRLKGKPKLDKDYDFEIVRWQKLLENIESIPD